MQPGNQSPNWREGRRATKPVGRASTRLKTAWETLSFIGRDICPMFRQDIFVQFDSETRLGGQSQASILHLEWFLQNIDATPRFGPALHPRISDSAIARLEGEKVGND